MARWNVTLKVGEEIYAQGRGLISVPLLFTANDRLDIGIARWGSPVSLDYSDKAPFEFNGTIDRMTVMLT